MNQVLIKSTIAGLITFLLGLILTSPKSELFFELQSKVSERKITLASKDMTNYFLFLKTNSSKLSSSSNPIVDFENGYFFASYIYNAYYISNPKSSTSLATILPIEAKSILISNSIISPSVINITASGDFGAITAKLNTTDGTMKAILKTSTSFEQDESMKNTKNMLMTKFKQTEEGLVYESNI